MLANEAATVAVVSTDDHTRLANHLGAMRGPLPDAAMREQILLTVEAA